ncbi:MAG: SiaC family regulatory phosphoprotein [Bacteroidia bacterium]|nr:SiaC family regulatory phosphoprotein [Bacteroidia bacterium]
MAETKNLLVEGTSKTPQIDLNQYTGELILSGRSIPENVAKIYDPVLAWIGEYIKSPHKTTNLRLNLEYFNTASSIWIAKIIKILSTIDKPDYVFFIHLYIDIEDTDTLDQDDIKGIMGSLIDNISEPLLSVGIRIYGLDENGKIVKESQIFI